MKFWFEINSKKFTSTDCSSFLSYITFIDDDDTKKESFETKNKKVFLFKSLPVNIAANKS